ncbi:MAG: DUF917 domain-containing protein, partial [bacterium]|nr:DUF917 domain-containing protein [bacterium]
MIKHVSKDDLQDLALGAGILGSGGGGDPAVDLLATRYQLEKYGPVSLISVDDLKLDDVVVPLAFMGAPSVSIERLPSGLEFNVIFAQIEKVLGKKPTVIMPAEIGGSNSLVPFAIAGKLGLPVLDADSLGRAFPELQMSSFNVRKVNPTPAFLADGQGNAVVITIADTKDPASKMEHIARHVTVAFGSSAAVAMYLMNGEQAKRSVIAGSVSLAINLGKIITNARANNKDPVQALCKQADCVLIGSGSIEDIDSSMKDGFLQGTITIVDKAQNKTIKIDYQNENLFAYCNSELIACTPDIIIPVDIETGQAITSDSLVYGLRVHVLVLAGDPLWKTPEGLQLVGPRAFGRDVEYVLFC